MEWLYARERVRTGFAFPSTLFLQYFQCVLTSIQPFCMHFTWNDVIRTVFPFFDISNWFNFHVFANQLSMNAIKSTECSVCVCVFVCDSMRVLTDVILRIKWVCMQIASNNQIYLSALPHPLIQHYLIQITLDYENLWNIKSAKTVLYVSFSYCVRFYVNAYLRDRSRNGRDTKSKEIVGITTTVLSCWVVSIFNYEIHLNSEQNSALFIRFIA